MNPVSMFNLVRDIPYRIPLKWGEEDWCCSGKHEMLYKMLAKAGFNVRYGVCVFLWSSMNLPRNLENIPHEDDCTHTYLEINIGGKWKVLDISTNGMADPTPNLP